MDQIQERVVLEIRRQRDGNLDKAEYCDLGKSFAAAIEEQRQAGYVLESWQLVSTNVVGPRSSGYCFVEVIVAVFVHVSQPKDYMDRRPMTGGLKMT